MLTLTLDENRIETQTGPKHIYRIVERCFEELVAPTEETFLAAAVETTRDRFADQCRIDQTLLVRREGIRWTPVSGSDRTLLDEMSRIDPAEYELLLRERILFPSGASTLAWWLLGSHSEWLAGFRLREPPNDDAELLLQVCRIVVQQKLLETGWAGMLDRARAIQRSLLPDPLPQLAGFDIAARSEPTDAVGGDVYDADWLSQEELSLTIADACGHGLPAALEARDVLIGLRMGSSSHRIESIVERLNRVLCRSTLSSRFVSLVHGELASNGKFRYVNAGHPPPVLVGRDGFASLSSSGRVLGVSPDSIYRVDTVTIPRGSTIVLFTDGVTECLSPSGGEFGASRVAAIARALDRAPAASVITAIFEALFRHSRGAALADDATVVVVRRDD